MSEEQRRRVAAKGGAWSDLFGGEIMMKKPEKIKKAAKAAGGMFKNLLTAVPGVGAILKLVETFDSLLILLKPFEMILKMINALLAVMSAEIIRPLFMALKPVMDVLMSLTPIFRMLGKIIGFVLTVGLIPLTVIFKILDKVLTPLLPLLDPFIKSLDQLTPLLIIITDILVNVLFVGIKWVFELIVNTVKGFVNTIIFIINGLIGLLNLIPGVDIAPLTYLQAGGIITSPTLAMIGETETEVVFPLSKLNEFMRGSSGVDPELIVELEENRNINFLILRFIREGY